MKQIKYTVQDALGIHARPAGLIVKKAKTYESEIVITIEGKTARADRLFEIMSLGAKQGQIMVIELAGKDEEYATTDFQEFLSATL